MGEWDRNLVTGCWYLWACTAREAAGGKRLECQIMEGIVPHTAESKLFISAEPDAKVSVGKYVRV